MMFGATYYLADKKVELKEYDEAEKLANDILAKYEDFYFAHLLLAEIYCEKGDYNKSVEHCNRVWLTTGKTLPLWEIL